MPHTIQADELTSEFHTIFEAGSAYFVAYTFLFGCVAVHNTISIMLAHTSRTKYQPFSRLYLFTIVSLVAMALIAVTPHQKLVNLKKGALGLTIAVALLQSGFLVILIREVAGILGISVFLTKQTV
mmetsp:Transcript_23157/g.27137  ORF Transcript_23157/g.27137 Transcript_23157/m.27137 type:complete len:126 (+) Transcript_23157:1063-1440(+)